MEQITHNELASGIELGVVELPDRHAVALDIRVLSGTAHEPDDQLGIARFIQETIDLGTESHDGQRLADCFDVIGASRSSWVGHEATGYQCLVLPEYLDRAVELTAEFLRTPTFPQDKVEVGLELTRQELNALDDDPHSLADKFIGQRAFGPLLGRHALGESDTVERIDRTKIVDHWRNTYRANRMMVCAAGAVETAELTDSLNRHFTGFGNGAPDRHDPFAARFDAAHLHYEKDTEQQQIAVAFPGVTITDPDFPVQQAVLAILSGGMSSRLFTEVREKQGLVYWVAAWSETPRGAGMIFLGASTTPDRCDTTYQTLLREIDRLAKDLTAEELDRAVTGLVAKIETQGDLTRTRCSQLAADLFHRGRYMPREEKIAKLKAVTIDDIRAFLKNHPRDRLAVVTLGPRLMEGSTLASGPANGKESS